MLACFQATPAEEWQGICSCFLRFEALFEFFLVPSVIITRSESLSNGRSDASFRSSPAAAKLEGTPKDFQPFFEVPAGHCKKDRPVRYLPVEISQENLLFVVDSIMRHAEQESETVVLSSGLQATS